MFLFDRGRTGRLKEYVAMNKRPSLSWKVRLPSYPIKGPESTPVEIDGRLYFGSHDGCFYCVSTDGKLEWSFNTQAKLYPSPVLVNGQIVVASGNGILYSFTKRGRLNWTFNLGQGYSDRNRIYRAINKAFHIPHLIDVNRRRLHSNLCWSSPNIDHYNNIVITSYGRGLYAINSRGEEVYSVDMGWPRYYLAGACIDSDNNIYVPGMTDHMLCIRDGRLQWRRRVARRMYAWSNPSIDDETSTIYCAYSRSEAKSVIAALTLSGHIKWRIKLPTGVRGTPTISYGDYIIVPGLNGVLYLVDKAGGSVLKEVRLSNVTRGLWTSASIDRNGNIYVSTKQSNKDGSVVGLNDEGDKVWEISTPKVLSVPMFTRGGSMIVGAWDGTINCYE